jgi:putative FmdB family regulatory protein
MPTYGYRCGGCGHEFEIRQSINDAPLTACPICGGKLAKMLYPAGVIFKGSGYYTTDYKGSGKSADESSNGADKSSNGVAPASEGSSATKSENKPEAKTETKPETKKPESKSDSTDKKGS